MQIERTKEGLAEQIRRLEINREKHAAALAEIDALLSQIGQALRSVNPAELDATPSDAPSAAASKGGKRRHLVMAEVGQHPRKRYHKLQMTGEQAILSLIQQRGRASTAEINAHWRAEGRGGVANNAIVRLLKRGELVREPIPASRGSWYRSIAATKASNPAEPQAAGAGGSGAPPSTSAPVRRFLTVAPGETMPGEIMPSGADWSETGIAARFTPDS